MMRYLLLMPFFVNAYASEQPMTVAASDGYPLNGVLQIPESGDQNGRPVVMILQGFGNVGMDGDVSSPFFGTGYEGKAPLLSKQIAVALSNVGVTTFRYNKRGFDDDSQLKNQTMPFLMSDAISAFKQIQSHYQGRKIGIIGFSEGALIASHIANLVNPDFLFLLAPPTRPVDAWFEYRFLTWPTGLLTDRLDQNHDGKIEIAELRQMPENFKLPLLEQPWSVLDQNADQLVSVQNELLPVYHAFYQQILELFKTPDFKDWYEALKKLPLYTDVVSKIKIPTLVYQGAQDPELDPTWIRTDLDQFKNSLVRYREYPGVGHCFAPLEGWLGERKTSGPLNENLLNDLKKDIQIF